MDTIDCIHCHKNVVPRLWHYQPFLNRVFNRHFFDFQHLKTQHICPLCGGIMFKTGGQLTLATKVLMGMMVCGFLFMSLVTIGEKLNPVKPQPAAVCKGSAAHCKAAVVKHK